MISQQEPSLKLLSFLLLNKNWNNHRYDSLCLLCEKSAGELTVNDQCFRAKTTILTKALG